MIRQNINIITWNVQGAGSREFLITLKNLIQMNDPTILALVETQINGTKADKVCRSIGFDGVLRAEATGFRGGIWVLWRKAVVQVCEMSAHHQAVSIEVKRNGEDEWIFSAIYASPTPPTREALWSHLLNVKATNSKPWLLMGDFNETTSMEERSSESENMRRRYGVETEAYAILSGGIFFPDALVKHLAQNQSGRTPILLVSNGPSPRNPSLRPFRFQAAWIMHDEFQDFVADHWQHGTTLPSALANLAVHLETWNPDVVETTKRNSEVVMRMAGERSVASRTTTPN
ncbi:hypothetical protein V2J09_011482 [Rumex salicifolius]